jgi:hypothetical protein
LVEERCRKPDAKKLNEEPRKAGKRQGEES